MTFRRIKVVMLWALPVLVLHLSGTAGLADDSAITPSAVVYLRPTPSIPCVIEACDTIQVVDFSLQRIGADGDLEIGTRLRLGDWAFLKAEVSEDNQSLGLTTSRWSFDLHSDQVSEGLEAEYRARHLRLRSSALRDTTAGSDGWLNEGELAYRLGADLELFIATLDDNRKNSDEAGVEQPTSSTSIGGLWQRGSHFELFAKFTDSTLETLSGDRLERETFSLDSIFITGPLRMETGLEYQDLAGRFPRQEGSLRIRADYRFWRHTLVHLEVSKRDDIDFGAIAEEIELGATFFARKHSYDRDGSAARSTVALHRRAYELGLNERRGHTLEERRRIRERLAISKQRSQLAGLIDDLYQAQVADRNVPLTGFTWNRLKDDLNGSQTTTTEIFWSIPWTLDRSIGVNQNAVEFLRFSFASTQRDITSGFRVQGKRLGLDLSLNRELKIEVAWEQPIFTGLDFILDQNLEDQFEFALVYRYGI